MMPSDNDGLQRTSEVEITKVEQQSLVVTRSDYRPWPHESDDALGAPPVRVSLLAWHPCWKTAIEFVFSLFLLILTLPVILVAALFVLLTSPGPIFYTQTRLGKNGRPFKLYKIRTMFHHCEKHTGAIWASPGDPRVTWIGRYLRKTHLDELPQLWNILRGDMSLVGPRPERPEFVPALEKAIPHYGDRLLVRPGVTGLAQVQLPADTDLTSVRRKLAYDLYYIRSTSFWLDFRLVACTFAHMVGVPFHVLCRWFVMPTQARVEDAYQTWRAEPVSVPDLQSA